MINILLLEDNSNKAKKILEVLSSIPGVTDANIFTAPDQVTARRYLLGTKFTLVFLDIQIPVRFEQDAQLDGGITFLQDIYTSNKLIKPDYVIGLTAYEESYITANPVFNDKLWALIKFDEGSDEWSTKIYNHVLHIIDIKKSANISNEYDYDLGIVCALNDIELESIKRLSEDWKLIYGVDGFPYYASVFQNESKKVRVIAAAAPQMGMVATSVLTTNMIQQFSPYYIAMTGIAAGISGKVNLGDILIADPSWDYGNGKVIDENGVYKFLPDIQQIRLDREIRAKFEQLRTNKALFEKIKQSWPSETPDSSLGMLIGPVASGASVLANSEVADSIKDQGRNLIGIEMEIYGFLYAAENCSKPRPKAFALKSVCDFASKEKNNNVQRYAAYTSASLLYEFVMNHLDFNLKPAVGTEVALTV